MFSTMAKVPILFLIKRWVTQKCGEIGDEIETAWVAIVKMKKKS